MINVEQDEYSEPEELEVIPLEECDEFVKQAIVDFNLMNSMD